MGGVRKTYFPYIPLYFNEIAHALQKKEPQGSMLDVASSLIAQKTMQSPFFMYVHYHGAHGVPYQAGQFLGSLLPKTSGLLDAKSQGKYYGRYQLKNQPMVDMLRLRYDEGVLNQDNTLKALIDTIKNAGYYDSSMIIITADHVQVFNNGYSSHCTPLLSYSETHVPLLIKYPNETNGETIHNVISTIDLTPTILDVAGVKYQQDWFDGISLLNNLPGPNSDPYVFAYQSGDLSTATVMNDRYKLTERGAGKYYLFDYIKDPAEKKNLYKSLGPDSDIVKEAMAALQKFQADVKNR
jgi:arylsulfatase A-like enzyme